MTTPRTTRIALSHRHDNVVHGRPARRLRFSRPCLLAPRLCAARFAYPWHLAFPTLFPAREAYAMLRYTVPPNMLLEAGWYLAASVPNPAVAVWPRALRVALRVLAPCRWPVVTCLVVLLPAWRLRAAWWPAAGATFRNDASAITRATTLAVVCTQPVVLALWDLGFHSAYGMLSLCSFVTVCVALPVWFLCVETHRARAAAAAAGRDDGGNPIARSGAHLLAVVYVGTMMPYVCGRFLALNASRKTRAGEAASLLVWNAANLWIYVAWAMVAAKRAITPAIAPPLQFAFMLTIDLFLNLVFLEASVETPVFWLALGCEVGLGSSRAGTSRVCEECPRATTERNAAAPRVGRAPARA